MRDRITLRSMAAPDDAAVGGGTVQAGRVLERIDKEGCAGGAASRGRGALNACSSGARGGSLGSFRSDA